MIPGIVNPKKKKNARNLVTVTEFPTLKKVKKKLKKDGIIPNAILWKYIGIQGSKNLKKNK